MFQAWGYGVYFQPEVPDKKKEKEKQKGEKKGDNEEDKEDKKQSKKASWYKTPEWRRWWAFCRSLGHRDMTIPTLYGAGKLLHSKNRLQTTLNSQISVYV